MAINKRTLLGKPPETLGEKDAVHTAIVALRAGECLNRADWFKINEHGEAVEARNKKESVGVVDPFRDVMIPAGESFWGVIDQKDIPNVKHVWEHPKHTFEAPTREVEKQYTVAEYAKDLKIPYDQLLKDLETVAKTGSSIEYTGPLTEEELEEVQGDLDELWSEWGWWCAWEFENYGSMCCPEYEYPGDLYFYKEKE